MIRMRVADVVCQLACVLVLLGWASTVLASDKESELVCPVAAGTTIPDLPFSKAIPNFVLKRGGNLTIGRPWNGGLLVIGLPDAKNTLIRVDVLDPATNGSVKTLACGHASNSVVISNVAQDDLLLVRVFEVTKDRPAALSKAEATLVGTLTQPERDAVHREAKIGATVAEVRAAMMTNHQASILSVEKAQHKLAAIHEKWCELDTARPLAPAICDETDKLQSKLTAIHTALVSITAKTQEEIVAEVVNLKIDGLLTELGSTDPPPLDVDAQCKGVARLRWYESRTAPRLVTRAQLPMVEASHLYAVSYGSNIEVRRVSPRGKYALLVTGVPVSAATTFGTHQGAILSADIASLIQTFGPIIGRVLPDSFIPLIESTGVGLNDDELRDQSLICPCVRVDDQGVESSGGNNARCTVSADLNLDPAASVEPRAFLFGPPENDRQLDAAVCDGAVCTAAADDKTVKTRVTLTPDRRGTWVLLAEFATGIGLGTVGDTPAGYDSFGFKAQSPASFQAVDAPTGPDQLFQMRQKVNPQNAFTTSLLLGVRLPESWLVAFGPSLLIGPSGSVLKQFSVRGGRQIANNLYFTFGPSVRFVPVPDAYNINDIVSVPIGMPGMATSAPTFTSHETALFQFDVGFALDLGNTASSAVSSLGGGK